MWLFLEELLSGRRIHFNNLTGTVLLSVFFPINRIIFANVHGVQHFPCENVGRKDRFPGGQAKAAHKSDDLRKKIQQRDSD